MWLPRGVTLSEDSRVGHRHSCSWDEGRDQITITDEDRRLEAITRNRPNTVQSTHPGPSRSPSGRSGVRAHCKAETSLPGPVFDPVHEQRGLSGQCISSGLNSNAAPEVLVEERGLATGCIDEHVLTRMAQRGRIPWRTASGSATGWAEASIVPVHRFDPKWVSGLNESRPFTRSLLLQ